MTTRTTTTTPSAIAIKVLSATVGAAIIGCVTHYSIAAIGGYSAPGAPLLIALASGLAVGAIVVGIAWNGDKRRVLACMTAFAMLCGETYALINTSERTLEQREARLAPVRKIEAQRQQLAEEIAKSETALAGMTTTVRIEKALEAKAATDASAISAVKERSCVDRCKARLDASVADAKLEVDKARAELDAQRREAREKIEASRAVLAALPAPATQGILAATIGVEGWKIDLLAAALLSIAANGLGAFLIAFAFHFVRSSFADSAQSSFAADDFAAAKAAFAGKGPEPEPPGGGKRRKVQTERLPTFAKQDLPANVIALPIRGPSAFAGAVHPVIAALELAGKPLSNGALANAMGVNDGESTKRRREVCHLIDEQKVGQFVMIGLKSWRQESA